VSNVCNLIQKHKIELLPTTPSFLAQLLISNAWKNHDLSSLKVISYGTEVMNEVILDRLMSVFPNCIFKQTYGLSETGVLQIHSESSSSLWFKFIENELDYKIEEDLLWLKTRSNLAGKIIFDNHRPFFEHNNHEWFCTNDLVSAKGEFIKILGRKSEIINVAGLKVFPSEVENCIFELDFIDDVVVTGKKHPLLGQMVVAYVKLKTNYVEGKIASENIIKKHCIKRLEKFKVPSKFIYDNNNFIGDRFKKNRLLLDN
jgi:acyl-coenzyme A synthetase/AMP-(fatty) acid ligase